MEKFSVRFHNKYKILKQTYIKIKQENFRQSLLAKLKMTIRTKVNMIIFFSSTRVWN